MHQSRQLAQLLETISLYRGLVLDAVEQDLKDSPNWKFTRSRILKLFGERGLELRIREIMGDAHVQRSAGV